MSFYQIFALHTCLGAKCTYEVFPPQRQYIELLHCLGQEYTNSLLSPLFHLIWTCGAGAVDDKGLDIYIHTILIFDIFSSSSYRGQCVYTPPLMLWGCVWLFMNKSKYLLLVYFLCIFPACYHYVTCSGETEQVADTNV